MAVTAKDVEALFKSRRLRAVTAKISAKIQEPVRRDDQSFTVKFVQGEIAKAGLDVATVQKLIDEAPESIAEIMSGYILAVKKDDPGEDYPPGEEPGPDEAPCNEQDSSIDEAVTVIGALYYHFLKYKKPADLRKFMKAKRMPKIPQHAKILEAIFAKIKT